MARSSHVVFDGYSYEPPSYEEAQASAAASQSVYKPTVSQTQDTNFGGFRPLYTPNGYNGLTEYNLAKRRRRMRIAIVTVLGIFCFIILLVILFWNINSAYHVANKYESYADKSDEDLTSYQGSSIYDNNNNYYRKSMNDNKPIQHSDDDVSDKTVIKANVENGNDPITNNGGSFVGYDWEKEAQKTLEKLQSEDFGIHLSNTRDGKESSINRNYDKLLIDMDEILRKEMEKWNINEFKDNSAKIEKEKETFADKNSGNPYDLNSMIQRELKKLKNGENTDNTGGYNFLDSHLQKEMEKMNFNPAIITPRNPTSTPDRANINISSGKSLDEVVKVPDLLTLHTSDIDINKVHDLLKSLKDDNNDNH